MLYGCYEMLRVDVVMELAWRHGLMDYAMPYLIQSVKEGFGRIEILEKVSEERGAKEELKEKQG